MIDTSLFTLLSLLLVAGVYSQINRYCDLHCYGAPMHTVCQRSAQECGPDPSCGPDFRKVRFTHEHRQQILDQHNELRNKVAMGMQPGQPPARNMKELTYNRELEFIVQCWLNACRGDPLEHDRCRRTAKFEAVGQNLAASYSQTGMMRLKISILATFLLIIGTWTLDTTASLSGPIHRKSAVQPRSIPLSEVVGRCTTFYMAATTVHQEITKDNLYMRRECQLSGVVADIRDWYRRDFEYIYLIVFCSVLLNKDVHNQ
ncbi:unnamed protein product [Phaedon cochleariae]|uniref:SCP domain-containing protein n=1 Tax=Phaedon cochleariae TaxID=80249 RepID=A0A9N9X5F3_PHACE|nr:unnamed protein product [Phaedon cochleariae]